MNEIYRITSKEYIPDHIYQFKNPYLFRAQNSSNRTGCGWTWDWSYGNGDYVEGTFYGETTSYVICGFSLHMLY